jgi:hypothetical protein
MFPKRIRTYLILNVASAFVLVIIMAVKPHLKSGRHLIADLMMLIAFAFFFATLVVLPLALVEIYLYRKKKGVWYDMKQGPRRPAPDFAALPDERVRRKNEALRARLARGVEPTTSPEDRTTLFQSHLPDGSVSRAALLLNVAVKLEGSGKREAAERCYRQIVERFGGSPPAREAAERLALITRTSG